MTDYSDKNWLREMQNRAEDDGFALLSPDVAAFLFFAALALALILERLGVL